jgi:hypothetical protein
MEGLRNRAILGDVVSIADGRSNRPARTAFVIEQVEGRAALIAAICDPVELLRVYSRPRLTPEPPARRPSRSGRGRCWIGWEADGATART